MYIYLVTLGHPFVFWYNYIPRRLGTYLPQAHLEFFLCRRQGESQDSDSSLHQNQNEALQVVGIINITISIIINNIININITIRE